MDRKQIFFGICLFIVLLSGLSVASAANAVDNHTISTASDDLNTISRTNNQEDILGDPAGNFTGLDSSIDKTPDGGTLSLEINYTYSSGDVALVNGIVIDKSITIDGKGHTLDASHIASIFNIGANHRVVLQNIHFINANGTNGGAIKLDSTSTLEIVNCYFIDNHVSKSGAAIYLSDSFSTSSYLKITGTTFINNTASYGGAIYLNESASHSSSIEDSSFINCSSTGDGGSAYISASNVAFRNVIFDNNIAGDDGGALYWEGSNGIIYNITCTNNRGISVTKKDGNTSSTRGGTIIITGSNITVSDSRFINGSSFMDESKDYSKVDGGALFVTGNDVTIDNVEFINCNATNNGGAVYVIGNRTHIYNCDFTDCIARDGAALYVNGTGCTLYNSTFTNNVANDDGGAIYWNGDEGYIYNITCINNKGVSGYDPLEGKYSSTRGGTICLTGSNVTLTKSSFTISSAYMNESMNYSKVDGGALFITGNDVIVNDTTFSSCSATNNGGAIYVIGNRTHIYNCDFNDCVARDGAALYVNGVDCTLYNSTFTDNIGNDDGGAIYWEGDNGYMYNITCINNKGVSGWDPLEGEYSNSKGGTICLTGSNVTIDTSSFAQSSAKSDGGALFITGNDVKVMHSNFTNCISTAKNGGAVYIIGNETHIFDCIFDDCKVDVVTDHRGGAIYVAGNDANITKSTFTNTEAVVGGAIFIEGNGTIVDDSTFKHNDAVSSVGGTGAAININGANAVIVNSRFSDGKAVNYGGAIAVWGSNAVLEGNTFNNSITTKFNGGAVFVDGANTTISLSNFTQCNALGDPYARGGAIDVQGDDARILDCNFDECDSHYGGVIYVSGTNAYINSSSFKNSEAYDGGAIYIEGINTTISYSNFTDVSARDYGGSIYVAGNNADILESNFIRSTVVNRNGGAIFVAGSNANIEKSNFTSSKALNTKNKALGGAIYIEGSDAVVNQSNFDDCQASEGGGAIYAYGNAAKIEDSIFTSNTAKYGGSIYLTSWGSSIKGSNVSGSIASENGGGVYVAEGSIQISESNFDDCIAKGTSSTNGGGAIYINGPDTHISSSNFTGNRVPGNLARGGAIFINGERTVIEGSEFDNNTANQGGVIFIEGKDAIIDTSKFSNSSSRSSGGSIYVKGDEATIRLSSFDNITAGNDGGAIYVDGARTNILNSSFYNCTVKGKKGGAIYIDDIGTTVAYSNFTLSKAGEGGAIYIRGVNTTISYCNLDENVADSAGAIKVYGDDTIISNCNFTYNNATSKTLGSGGALDIGGSNASVYYSWFDHNDAVLDGGAINWLGGHGDDSIIGSTFTNNVAHDTNKGGGAIYWTQGNVIASGGLIKDSIFINNTAASRHGGAIDWFHAKDSRIENCLFINNTAARDGGALYTGDQGGKSTNLTIIYSQFYNNTAGLYGGAIANQMADSYLFNNTFDGNKANAGGGSILMKEGPAKNCIIDHCYIYNSHVGNVSGGYGEGGGAILLGVKGDSNITISNSAIFNSTIERGPGGAIAMLGSDCSLINVTIEVASTQNDDGGAIYWKGANGMLNNVTIFNSSSNSVDGSKSSDGGAIHVSGWYCTLNDIKIFKSSANNDENCAKTNNGGAIYISGSSDVLTNIIIDNSSSKNVKMNAGGGAIYYAGYGGTLVNATISNTFASGNGGAIYWRGSTPKEFNNISITYSQTEVIDSANSADGGAIYATTLTELNNVTIEGARAYKNTGDVHGGAIYLKDGKTLNNVTVIGSRASTDDGISQGGAVYFTRERGSSNIYVYNSTFEENNADLGGGLYFKKITARIYGSSFTGNVANQNGGALYSENEDELIYDSTIDHNSAKKGGGIFSQDGHVQLTDSLMEFNTAEEKGGAIYYNYNNKGGSSIILRSDLLNNTAFQGSAIYGTKFNRFSLQDSVLLDNQANSKTFIEKHVGVDEQGNNYTSAIFLGFDNLLNAIWQESTYALSCSNVTYWGVDNRTKANSAPKQSDREVNINVTVEVYDGRGVQLTTADVVTDKDGKVTYNFDAKDGETYYFAYVHKADRYYTYLRDTLSNRSIVNIYVHNPIFYSQNQTVLIELTDGAWGNLNGTVTVTFNDTNHTTFEIEVLNGTGARYNISGLPIGHYNATASFSGDLDHTGDTDWALFEVVPYNDLHITKEVNITADYVNVSDVIKYTITVTNHGPSKAYGVNVTERLSPYLKLDRAKATTGSYNLTGGYWYIGDLEVGDFETLTITAEVIHMGPITNTVWVTGLGNDTNLSNNVASARNFTAVDLIDLRIYKTVNVTAEVVNVLDIIQFNITVFNDGPSNATGVVVEEPIDGHLKIISNKTSTGTYRGDTWNIGYLAKGANATLTIVARIAYPGNISNAVHVFGFENESNYKNNYAAIKNLTAIANVDLKVTKEVNVSGSVNVTDKIKFTINVTNNGPCNATGVYVSEILSKHLKILSNTTTKGDYDGATWIVGDLNKGETQSLTIIAEVISAGTISNAVAIFGSDNDTNKSNNNDSIENITSFDIVDLQINKTVDIKTSTVNVSDRIVFTITVKNNGPCDATNVNVTEKLSPHLKMIEYHTWASTYDVGKGIWYIGTLTKGDWRELVITAEVISAGNISNVVVVTSSENDTNKSNNKDEIPNITAIDIVDLQIKKEVNVSGVINVTDYIKYTITVFNAGPSNATNVNVSEVLSSHLKLIKAETANGYYNVTKGMWYIGELKNQSTAVLTIHAQVITNGTISNVVEVNSTEKDTDLSNNKDQIVDIAAVNIVDLQINKTVNASSTDIDITEVIMFNITVYNAGPCNATDVYVCEPLSDILQIISNVTSQGSYDGYTWIIGNLTSGSTATLTIVAQSAYSGTIENAVNVTCREIDTNLTNNKDNITPINVSAHMDLAINKTVNVTTGVVNVSDLIEFTVIAYNNGPCNASGVYVYEALDTAHLTLVSSSATKGVYDNQTTWNIGFLNAGENATLTIVAEVTAVGNFSNYVAIFGFGNDTNMSNNNASIPNITAKPIVDLNITKSVNVGTVVDFNDTIIFTITVRNKGPCEATNVNVTEALDSHLKLVVYHTWGSDYNVTEGIWHIGTLAKGDWRQLIIEARVIAVGNITNVVSVNSTEEDTNKSNNNASIPNITAMPIVDLQIKKESNVTGDVVNVTDYIKYTITVFNDGPCNATNVNVSEVLSSHLRFVKSDTANGYYNVTEGIWHVGDLKNQSTAVLTIEAQVVSEGIISNVVVVNSTEKDTDLDNNRAAIDDITAVIVFDLQIKKVVNVSRDIDVTEIIMFNITVHNAGPCNATDVYVAEPLSYNLRIISNTTTQGTYDGYTWIIGNMTSGSTVNLTIVASIAYGGIIENKVNVTGRGIDYNLSNNKDNVTLNATAHVDLSVSKIVVGNPTVVNVSDKVEFVVEAYNDGPCNASGVYVSEILDFTHLGRNFTYYVSAPGTTYDGRTWIIGNLNSKERISLTIVAWVIAPGNFTNYVEIFCYDNDTNKSNNNASISNITAKPIVDLNITKTDNITNRTIHYNDTILFTITVRNNGPSNATNVNVTEVLDSHLKLVSYSTGANYNVTSGVWYIGDLAKDDWRQLEIVARVTSVGNITNAVSVNSTEEDTNKSNNNASVPNITAIPIVDLNITKEVNVTGNIVNVTDYIKYTITVYNAGPCNATNVNVSEVLSGHLRFVKSDTANGYYNVTEGIWHVGDLKNKSSAVLTIEAQVMSNGTISNVVAVNSTEMDTNMSNNWAETKNLTSVIVFDLQIKKSVNVSSTNVDVTDKLKFTITVHNAGPCNATDVYVIEPLAKNLIIRGNTTTQGHYDGYKWYIGNMTNGSTVNLTIDVDIDYAGIIVNRVNVTGTGIDYNLSNNKDSLTLNATAHVDLQIFKLYTGNNVVNVSDLVEFTVIAYNGGPCNASGVYVLEELDFTHLGRNFTYIAPRGTTYDGHIWDIGRLNVHEVLVLRISAWVIAPGNFSNYVEIHGYDNDTDPSNNNDTIDNITALPIVDLNITKESDVINNTVYYNDTITFTITVRNNGPCNATNVTVNEVLDSHLKLESYSAGANYNVTSGVWYIGDLANGDWRKLEIIARVISIGNITNVVNVTSTENDTDKSNNNASIPNITAKPIVDLRINKTVNVTATEVPVTEVIKFTITVSNDGPCDAVNVYVYEPLSDCLSIISNTTGNNTSTIQWYDGYTWFIGNLTNGTNTTLTIEARIVYSGIIRNYVNVTSNMTDIDPSNNEDQITPITAVTKVDLAINKTVNVTTGIVNVGDLVEFNITATNNGPCNASGVYVLEALDFNYLVEYSHNATPGTTYDGYTWYIGYLDAGATATLTIVARVTEPGNFSNYVEIFGFDEDTNMSNNNDTIPNITAIPVVDLDITKEVNVNGEVLVGQTVVFTVTVRNNGPCDATNVNVTEVLSPHLEMVEYITWDSYYDVDAGIWYIGDLAKNDWRQIIIVTEVVSVGNITNAVSVNSTENDTDKSNNNDTIPNITAKPAVDLQITKDVNVTSRFVEVTDYIEYIIVVYNDGPCNATNVNVSEPLNSYLKFVNATTEFGYYNATEGIWHIGNMTNGSYVNLTIVAQVIRDGIVISNVVVVNSTENDTDPYNNRDEVIIAALPVVDLRVNKTVNVTSDEIGVTDYIEFTITVFNDGPCNATGVYVIESLSDKLALISNVTSQGHYDGYTWNIDNITVGNNVTLTIVAQVIYAGNISNAVVGFAYQNETNYTNNNASIKNITAITNVDLQITKKVNVSVVNVTDKIEFTISVTNVGPCNATGVYVSEVLNSHLKIVSNTTTMGEYDGATWVIGNLDKGQTHNLTIIAEVISSGNITNFVNVTSNDNDTNRSNDNASIKNVTAFDIVDLNITKTVDVTGVVALGDSVVFTITVWNNGPCDATNVNVTEVLSPHLKMIGYSTWDSYYNVTEGVWYIGKLAKDDWRQLIISTEVISAGNITNVVVVTSTENDTNKSNNNASIPNITAVDVVDLTITKDVNVKDVVLVGQTVVFTITVRNIGLCDATNVNVTEVLSPHLKMIGYSTWNSEYNVTEGVWYIGTLIKGDWRQLVIVAEVVSPGNISNVVAVTSSENDTNESNNNASIKNITALDIVDLTINKTVDVTTDTVCIGDSIIFTITVRNNGPCDATNVNVTEVLSPHLKMVDYHTWNSEYNVTEGVWYIGKLAKNDWRQLIIETQVISAGNITNVVSVNSTQNDTNKSNNNASVPNITAVDVVDLSINKTVDVTTGSVCIGDSIIFTITVRNNGPCDATNVNVTEVLSPHLKMVDYHTWNSEYNVTEGIWYIGDLAKDDWRQLIIETQVISAGNITNVVSVNSTQNDTNKSNNNASIPNITAWDVVDLNITKKVNVGDVVLVGQTVIFTITVWNNGPCDATNVNVTEVLSPHLKMVNYYTWNSYYNVTEGIWYIGNLAKNDWRQLIIETQVISAGNITNAVVITSTENDTNKSNNNASIPNITAKPAVDLYITKTANVSGVVNVTGIIEFDIVVYNAGPCNATNVNVSEVLSPHLKLLNNITQNGYYDVGEGIWYIGNLTSQNRAYLSIIAQVISNGTISNVVVVTSSENDTDPSTNRDEIDNITAVNIVDVSVNKTVSKTTAKVGDEIVYVITVHNYGPCDATDVNVTEKLSDNVVLIKYNATIGDYNASENIWYIGKLTNGSTHTLTLTVEIIREGTIENAVILKSNETDTNMTNNNYTSENVTAEKYSTPIDLKTENITYGEDEILVVILPKGATGVVNITVGDRNYTDVPINQGIVELPVVDLGAGDYNVTVVYGGNDKYLPNSTSGIFNVAKLIPIITIEVADIWVWEIEVLNVTVNAPGVVFVTVNNITVEIPLENGVVTTDVLAALNSKLDYMGNATWNIIGLPVGTYPAFALYPGNENYTSVNTSDVFHVRDLIPTDVVVTADDIHVGENATINIKVGPKGVTGNVTVVLENETYTVSLDENGNAQLIVPGLSAGEKDVHVYYNGTDLYLPSDNATTFDVLKVMPPVSVDAPEITVGEDGIITVTVPQDATGTITIEIEGKRYTADIENGKAVFIIRNLTEGIHAIKAYYSGDDKYLPANATGNIKVNPLNETENKTSIYRSGISLASYPTGNPILVILLILLCLGSSQIRRRF
ncbi:Ig-like domain repeat protein [uncultured Methanobrevibacter sp.]|uniref:Ig-like domain repeat protein n=1 Tax=uncultured Methanobrevibacter sp. TaxID=253161 RepID=UPI0026025093|nr:Ig-like domain repeat protein [uncultured Methanobrevibacter sp.]